MPIIPATQEAEVEGLWFEALSGKKKKKTKQKKTGGMDHVHDTPSSSPSTTKQINNKSSA
jgi:hypothetical protein